MRGHCAGSNSPGLGDSGWDPPTGCRHKNRGKPAPAPRTIGAARLRFVRDRRRAHVTETWKNRLDCRLSANRPDPRDSLLNSEKSPPFSIRMRGSPDPKVKLT